MMPNVEREPSSEEIPTAREVPSGKWIIAVDRASQLIHRAILRLESHEELEDVAAALEDLRNAAELTHGQPSSASSTASGVVRAIAPSPHP